MTVPIPDLNLNMTTASQAVGPRLVTTGEFFTGRTPHTPITLGSGIDLSGGNGFLLAAGVLAIALLIRRG